MKKISDTYLFLIMLILAIGLFALVYFVPLKNTNDQINSLRSRNTSLTNEISELQVYHDNRAQYESDIETLKKEIVKIAVSYPSAYREEDYILEGVAMEKASDYMQYSGIRINEPEVLVAIEEDVMKQADIEGYGNKVEFVRQTVDYSNQITYDSLKQALAEAFDSGYRANIQNVTYVKDEDSLVAEGVISIGYYYVNGNGREYVAPAIKDYERGTNNLFLGGKELDILSLYSIPEVTND